MFYFLSLLLIVHVTLFTAWCAYFQLENENLIVRNIVNVEHLHIETVNEITRKTDSNSSHPKLNAINKLQQLTTYDIHNKIKKSSGRGLQINIGDEAHGKSASISFNYHELPIPPKIEDEHRPNRSFDKYVFVYAEYTEQMSMSMLSVLSLSGQAQFGGRKVVRPFLQKSRFTSKEKNSDSLGILFDLNYLDYLLYQADYSPMVDKQEYKNECQPTDPNHVTIHFLYIGTVTKIWNKSHFKITDEFYDSIFEKTKATGWTECSFLDANMGVTPSTKQFCINPTIIKDWKILERDIVGGAKCLNVFLWRGIGGGVYRSYFTENDLKFPHTAIQYALKPSVPIQNEVHRFRKEFLPDRFIAVYVRAEFILVPHQYNFNFLKKCINVIVQVIDALKTTSGISHVYVASDMSQYGSGSLLAYVAKAKLDHNPFPEIFTSLVSRVGGVVYNYNASTSEITDRAAIALVDWSLMTQAQYLITAGRESMSSFLRWVIGTFLANHRDDKELWSKISVCDK